MLPSKYTEVGYIWSKSAKKNFVCEGRPKTLEKKLKSKSGRLVGKCPFLYKVGLRKSHKLSLPGQ